MTSFRRLAIAARIAPLGRSVTSLISPGGGVSVVSEDLMVILSNFPLFKPSFLSWSVLYACAYFLVSYRGFFEQILKMLFF